MGSGHGSAGRAGSLSNSSGRVSAGALFGSRGYGASGASRARLARSMRAGRHQLSVGQAFSMRARRGRPPVVAPGGEQHIDGAHAAQRRPGLRLSATSGPRSPAPRAVEAYAAPLRRYLAQLDVIALAARPSAATGARRSGTERRLAAPGGAERSMAAQSANSGPLSVRIEAEHARAKAAFSTAFSSASSAPSVDAASLPGMSSASWNLQGRWYSVSRHRPSGLQDRSPVSISQAEPRSSSGSPADAANRRASPRAVALGPAARVRLLYPHFLRSSRARHSRVPALDQRYMVEAETSNCPARPPRCAPASPRATSDLMAAIIDSDSRSSRSTPARRASSSSAIAWALAAGTRPASASSSGSAQLAAVAAWPRPRQQPRAGVAGRLAGPPPLPGPRDTERLRDTSSATVEGERPKAPRPSACTTCACPVRSRSRPCQPCRASCRASACLP